MNKKIFGIIVSFVLMFTPFIFSTIIYNSTLKVEAATTSTPAVTSTPNSGIVPDCGKVVTTIGADGKETSVMNNPCTFTDLVQLLNNVIKFLLFSIATPLIALILMYTGYLYLTAGGSSGQTEKVRHILFNAVIGYVVALAAWLIVKTILSSLNVDSGIETFL
jgi:hypothetical protein